MAIFDILDSMLIDSIRPKSEQKTDTESELVRKVDLTIEKAAPPPPPPTPTPQPVTPPPQPATVLPVEKQSSSKVLGLRSVIVLLLLIILAGGVYIYMKREQKSETPDQVAQDEITSVIQSVGKLIVLPQDEVPTLATVADPQKLQGQTFFAAATKGDKVLIYTKAKKAILYNPTKNIIVEVAPLNLGQTDGGSQ